MLHIPSGAHRLGHATACGARAGCGGLGLPVLGAVGSRGPFSSAFPPRKAPGWNGVQTEDRAAAALQRYAWLAPSERRWFARQYPA
jgi:hypothetical protein